VWLLTSTWCATYLCSVGFKVHHSSGDTMPQLNQSLSAHPATCSSGGHMSNSGQSGWNLVNVAVYLGNVRSLLRSLHSDVTGAPQAAVATAKAV